MKQALNAALLSLAFVLAPFIAQAASVDREGIRANRIHHHHHHYHHHYYHHN